MASLSEGWASTNSPVNIRRFNRNLNLSRAAGFTFNRPEVAGEPHASPRSDLRTVVLRRVYSARSGPARRCSFIPPPSTICRSPCPLGASRRQAIPLSTAASRASCSPLLRGAAQPRAARCPHPSPSAPASAAGAPRDRPAPPCRPRAARQQLFARAPCASPCGPGARVTPVYRAKMRERGVVSESRCGEGARLPHAQQQ